MKHIGLVNVPIESHLWLILELAQFAPLNRTQTSHPCFASCITLTQLEFCSFSTDVSMLQTKMWDFRTVLFCILFQCYNTKTSSTTSYNSDHSSQRKLVIFIWHNSLQMLNWISYSFHHFHLISLCLKNVLTIKLSIVN